MPPDAPGNGDDERVSSPDAAWLQWWLSAASLRWRATIVLRGAAIGIGAALLVRALLERHTSAAGPLAMAAGSAASLALIALAPGIRDWRAIAAAAERGSPDLRNALVTWLEMRGRLSPAVADRLASHARRSLSGQRWPHPYSLHAWAIALVLLAAGGLAAPLGSVWETSARAPAPRGARPAGAAPAGPLQWSVDVMPPLYARTPPRRVRQPARIDVLSGSRLNVAFVNWPPGGTARSGSAALPLHDTAGGPTLRLTPSASGVLTVHDAQGRVVTAITLVVAPDRPPMVRVTAPAADLRRAVATGVVPIAVTAQDDIGLRDLRLRFTKVSGSGESFTFEDGEWPVQVARTTRTAWTGTYRLDLDAVGLAPGDSLVYHAIAHDARVGPEGAAESERFLIEIPRPGALAAGDFSLPAPEDRFALSQRMVIQLTERLLERRPRMTAETFLQESQGLAIAQRRVRAEFVFMLGGEVEDEFEEAAHAHEVEEGRQANRGKGELTDAVREMSRAETALTAAAVSEALPYEYRALAALQAAFGRARYFMRTLPAAVQIDVARRLQGDRSGAASSRWAVSPLPDQARQAAFGLLEALEQPHRNLRALLPDLVAIDRDDPVWVAEVQQVTTRGGSDDVARLLRARLLAGSPTWMQMPLPRTPAEASLSPAGTEPRR